jgi:DNA-binding transcriptional regulator LsrR (DeoR family)
VGLCRRADLTLVGVGQMDASAPIHLDGFASDAEMAALIEAGAVGEITSWVYDRDGQIIDCAHNTRVASAPLHRAIDRLVIGVAVGKAKVPALAAALRGNLMNGLITSEATAERILALTAA